MAGESPDISGRDREGASTLEGGQSSEKTPETPERVPQDVTDPGDEASETTTDAPGADDARSAPPAEGIPRPSAPANDTGEPVPRAEPAPDGAESDPEEPQGPAPAPKDDDAPRAPENGTSGSAGMTTGPEDPQDPEAARPDPHTPEATSGTDEAPPAPAPKDDDDAGGSAEQPSPGPEAADPDTRIPEATSDSAAAQQAAEATAEPAAKPADPRVDGSAAASAEAPAKPSASAEREGPREPGADDAAEDSAEDSAGGPAKANEAAAAQRTGDAAAKSAESTTVLGTAGTRGGAKEPRGTGTDSDGAASGSGKRPSGVVDRPTTALRVDGGRTAAPPPPAAPPSPAQPPAPPRPAVPPPPADADRDPMELLAALTNRPPPSPTPLRVAARRLKIWTPLALLLLIAFVVAQSLRPLPDAQLEVTAAELFTFDGETPSVPWPESGQAALGVQGIGSFGGSGGSEPVPIASVAKVMTAYVLLQEWPLEPGEQGPGIEIDQRADDEAGLSESDDESTVEVREGDSISEYEALQAILIASANNVARLVARSVFDSEETFIEKMNETAEELGMENTTYTDPSGLEADTVSTAADQVLLAEAAMADPVFREVVGVSGYTDSYGDDHGNWNYLVPVDGVVGIKTGTTTAAGGCLMFAAEQEIDGERQLILGAVLGQPPHPSDNSILTGALTAGEELMDFAQDELVSERVFEAGDVVGEVDDGLGRTTPVTVTADVTAVGWPGLKVRVELAEAYRDPEAEEDAAAGPLPHSADADTRVGQLLVGDGDDGVTVPVALAEDLVEPGFGARLLRIG